MKIIICENTLFNKRSIEDTLKHELIHSYDYCRANVDTDNCLHTSCAEIRAVNLSGECNFSREIGRMNFSILNHYKVCLFNLYCEYLFNIIEGLCEKESRRNTQIAYSL